MTLTISTLEEAWLETGPRFAPSPDRTSPRAAFQEVIAGHAILVDIRDHAQRSREGEVNPLLSPQVHDPVLLEWRFDPRSETRLPEASYDARLVLLGDEAPAARAARQLRELGIREATHVAGGFAAWREAGLPTR